MQCDVCGQDILVETAAGDFDTPIINILTGQTVSGKCCGVCGPKVNDFVETQCTDFDALPDGPLKGFLIRLNGLYHGQHALGVLAWLVEHHATVRFYRSDLVAGGAVDTVEVTATTGTQTCKAQGATLDEAVDAARKELEGE